MKKRPTLEELERPEIAKKVVTGASLFLIASLIFLALWTFHPYSQAPSPLGIFGTFVGHGLCYLFGLNAFLIPIYVGYLGYRLIFYRTIEPWLTQAWFFFLFLVSFSLLLSMLSQSFPSIALIFKTFAFTKIEETREIVFLGGVPFYYLYDSPSFFSLSDLLGKIGTFFVCSFLSLLALFFLFDTSLLRVPLKISLLATQIMGVLKKIPLPKRKNKEELSIKQPRASKDLIPPSPYALSTSKLGAKNPSLSRQHPLSNFPPPSPLKKPVKEAEENKEEFLPTPPPPGAENYKLPPTSLLTHVKNTDSSLLKTDLRKLADLLEETLLSFGIEAKVGDIQCGPTITLFEVHPAVGVKVQKIKTLENDIALNLQARSLRIIAPIPGKAAVGIEVPNPQPQEVSFRELIESYQQGSKKAPIPLLLGKAVNGEDIWSDLAKMPHCIIAGATGSGKSVCINTIVMSILMTARPDEIKLVMVDPKKVELSAYSRLPHMLAPVITEPKEAHAALNWLVKEMERRYEIFRHLGIRNISSFNSRPPAPVETPPPPEALEVPDRLPYIVVIVDELADLMMVSSSDIETPIARIAQMARAVGIHLILATQRPSREVITGLIKANFPTRISFKVSSRINSQIIIDETGAESLLGNGDMLFMPPGTSNLARVQGAYVRDEDINKVIDFICKQSSHNYLIPSFKQFSFSGEGGSPHDSEEPSDPLYEEAKALVLETGTASTTFLQRKLKIGYARAASLMDELEKNGIIGPQEGAKPRKIFFPSSQTKQSTSDLEDDDIETEFN